MGASFNTARVDHWLPNRSGNVNNICNVFVSVGETTTDGQLDQLEGHLTAIEARGQLILCRLVATEAHCHQVQLSRAVVGASGATRIERHEARRIDAGEVGDLLQGDDRAAGDLLGALHDIRNDGVTGEHAETTVHLDRFVDRER